MKTLLLLRHAKSSWDSPAARDFDRPLGKRGERDAPRVGKALANTGISLDLAVVSSARRARETAALALEAASYRGEVRFVDEIYEASVEELLAVVRALPDAAETALLVGHNPGFEDLIASLCGRTGHPAQVRVPTATLACVELAVARWSSVAAGSGTLNWMLVPKLL
jgi:phosphohistidine phosphatase